MNSDLFSSTFLEVTYRPDLGLLMGRWLRSVTETELRLGYNALHRAALHHGCGHWLIDSRRRVCRCPNSAEWVTTQYLPQVQQALGEPLRVGVLVLPDYLASLPQAYSNCSATSPVQFARFVDEGAANVWLGVL
ncbi:hypothetical protein GKZ68_07775 [Hymenobacter sp. BRD128]|uniref:hypothetical protein n=1 Tax=Hymenobacter sp. BRD128 TaxID=2675878 RepID=UPI0015635F44|nr:hypothetical protein [Hymenobacter sp. BRD128]QKG56537.1 hypothetical protein GKZ68_07775 [Hymenobacter sp. BRD128]